VTDDAEELTDVRIPWVHLLLVSYSSAVTLALVWMLWAGRTSPLAATPQDERKTVVADPVSKSDELDLSSPPPPIPAQNLTTLGKPVRIGDLEIIPLSVISAPVDLVRATDQNEYRRQDDESLVLRLRLTNLSKQDRFAPLDRYLVREHGSRAQDPFIVASDGSFIPLFPLAIDSEWSILGQAFSVLHPGETMETIIAAEAGSGRRVRGQMTWRVRLRTGVYRTDLMGVQFNEEDVTRIVIYDNPPAESSPSDTPLDERGEVGSVEPAGPRPSDRRP
jgi:hypothetical protein